MNASVLFVCAFVLGLCISTLTSSTLAEDRQRLFQCCVRDMLAHVAVCFLRVVCVCVCLHAACVFCECCVWMCILVRASFHCLRPISFHSVYFVCILCSARFLRSVFVHACFNSFLSIYLSLFLSLVYSQNQIVAKSFTMCFRNWRATNLYKKIDASKIYDWVGT